MCACVCAHALAGRMDLALFQQGQQGRSIAVGRGHALTPSSVSNASIASPVSVSGNHHLPGLGGGGGTGALGGLDYRGIVSHDADATMSESHESGPSKKKQKRNKPTLSCHECVERKTKVSDCACATLTLSQNRRPTSSIPFP